MKAVIFVAVISLVVSGLFLMAAVILVLESEQRRGKSRKRKYNLKK